MYETERRHATRYEATVPVSLSITAPIEIEGKMVNYSSAGVLIVSAGHVDVISSNKNKGYRGRLVRAFPKDRHTTASAIAFEEGLEDSVGTQTREAPSPPTGHHQGEPEEAGQSPRETASERKHAENLWNRS